MGKVIATGDLPSLAIPIGKNIPLGKINFDPSKITEPKNLKVTVRIRNNGQATAIVNAASLTFSIGTFDQAIVSPALPYSLAGGMSVDIVYDVAVGAFSSSGASKFTSNTFWHDFNWPASASLLVDPLKEGSWNIAAVGIKLSRDLDFNFEQADFNPGQTIQIRAYGVPLSRALWSSFPDAANQDADLARSCKY